MYNMGKVEDYPESQVLQMIGRAGRPQFDDRGWEVSVPCSLCHSLNFTHTHTHTLTHTHTPHTLTHTHTYTRSYTFILLLTFLFAGTAVIMTRASTRGKYESLVGGLEQIESSLHENLIEHLNAEVVLQTITNSELMCMYAYVSDTCKYLCDVISDVRARLDLLRTYCG
jgi:hypothetical protein